jgi:hypothetical protein
LSLGQGGCASVLLLLSLVSVFDKFMCKFTPYSIEFVSSIAYMSWSVQYFEAAPYIQLLLPTTFHGC